MRVGYGSGAGAAGESPAAALDPSLLRGDPPWRTLFDEWLAQAVEAAVPEPNAMVLGTVDADGLPATRTVLCKGVDDAGIVFYTGYRSGKGRALAVHPYASATFPWIAMERQVHIRGAVTRVSAEQTREYWESRPRGSQLSAYASAQSEPIASRDDLRAAVADARRRFGDDTPVPVPEEWGGYRIEAQVVEFWQGRADRLHDRVRAVRTDGRWTVERLQP
nr:pyridoxamine 5'-phosphate oxidase [Gordonia shandongensis]